jgi:hypothetical protein
MRILKTVALAVLAITVFVAAGTLAFTTLASLIWFLTDSVVGSQVVGAILGVVFGGLLATALVLGIQGVISQR